MLRRVALVRTDFSEELSASFIKVKTLNLTYPSSCHSFLTERFRESIMSPVFGWNLLNLTQQTGLVPVSGDKIRMNLLQTETECLRPPAL
jgi:hypothetical protein